MFFGRRRFLQMSATVLAAPAFTRMSYAQSYPSKPVRLIVGFPAGNAPDIVGRLIAQALSERLGQQFIVDNRPGAASNIALEATGGAPPDGYTLFLSVLTNVFNATLYPDLKTNFITGLEHLAGVADAPFLMIVNPSVPAKTVSEFVSYARANPGKLNYASGGSGSSSHIFGALFVQLAKLDMVHVPYRGPYIPDLLSGQVHTVIGPMPQAIKFYRSGELRALGVSTAKRVPQLPEIPPIGESVPGYEAIGWYGLSAPKGVPPEVVERLSDAMVAILAEDQIRSRLSGLGVQPMPMASTDFTNFVANEHAKWAEVIRVNRITVN
jgi:tripartite-type tricarboxylate transporter receptor subunit TctC